MSENVKKFGLLKGLSDIYVCEVNDTEEAYTPVGTPEKLIPAGEMTASKSFDKTAYYFDNTLFDESGVEAGTELILIGAAVRPAFLAWLESKTVDSTTGAIIDDGTWHRKYFAISGKKDYTDGTSELFWFLKCSYGGAEESSKTIDDSSEANGMELPFTAYKTLHSFTTTGNGAKVMRVDTSVSEMKAEKKWTDQVVTPDNLSTLIQKKTS